MPLRLAPHGSVFVVFRKPVPPDAEGKARSNWSADGPAHEIGNCIPHLFDEAGLERAIAGIERLVPSRATTKFSSV